MRALLLMLAVVAGLSCDRGASSDQSASTAKYRILALGDSYTIGEAVSADERFPVQLAKLLRQNKIDAADPQIIARTGWTTDELSAAIDAEKPTGPYDLVTLLIGVNNQFRGRSLAEYETHFTDLLNRSIQFAGNHPERVVVVAIPDWGVMPFAQNYDRKKIASEIDAFNVANRKIAESKGAKYVDIAPISREAASDPPLIARDGLHPSGKQYSRWVQKIVEQIVGHK